MWHTSTRKPRIGICACPIYEPYCPPAGRTRVIFLYQYTLEQIKVFAMQWEIIIGLEVHAQLSTQSKIFSGASTAFGAAPNSEACAVDLALPGVLPVLNRSAVDRAIRLGLAVGAKINSPSIFARKNYFYPDLPKRRCGGVPGSALASGGRCGEVIA